MNIERKASIIQSKDTGYLVLGFGFQVSGTGFRVEDDFGYRISGTGFQVQGFGHRVSGTAFRVQDFGYRILECSTCPRSGGPRQHHLGFWVVGFRFRVQG